MKRDVLAVALRKNAIVIPTEWMIREAGPTINETSSVLLANCKKLGFTFSEDLLHAINAISPKAKLDILSLLKEVTGVNKNWTPLVKQWDMPTGESRSDHIITWLSNVFQIKKGTQLLCGHFIPANTFPLDRYNGCPYCGTPFEIGELDYEPGRNKLKVLQLWTEKDLTQYLRDLLASPLALDATAADDVKILLTAYGLPDGIEIKMKETLMLVLDELVQLDQIDIAGTLFKSPNDILRYLWYKHTGFLQIIEPKTIAKRMAHNAQNLHRSADQSEATKIQSLQDLKLKFDRKSCRRYAGWLNGLDMAVKAQCENMHPKRGIWVRVIRALRLAEYSKKPGFEALAELLDTFYNENYEVWQGKVNASKMKADAEATFALLKQRPGLFARSLFSAMLWFGPDISIQHFREIIHQVPPRLIFTLNMYAEVYFDRTNARTVKPLGGTNKRIPANQLLELYADEELKRMQLLVRDLSLLVIKEKLKKEENPHQTIFIDEGLFQIPIAIGDRSEQLQDLPGALMGTRFKVEGDTVRLFLQWGNGLQAQHLDMDLSCKVVYEKRVEFCSYSQLVIPGCKHSGDIQRIPKLVGTAEYIDLDVNKLAEQGAKYVSFSCNAYTNGSLSPNLVVGWMNSKFPMKISSKGVAYDPTAVQHQVRIKQTLTKGMVFGVLDVARREIVWLELSFGGQIVQNLDADAVEALLRKLDAKLKIGELLKLKAEVQGLEIVSEAEKAEEVYDLNWALNTAEVSKLFLVS
ncbi:MAG: hypothetical protein AAF206_10115 [Bacteroidota bacterium]